MLRSQLASIANKFGNSATLQKVLTGNLEYVDNEQQALVKDLQRFLKRPSVTPDDAGCIEWLANQLQALGFHCDLFKCQGVTNLIAHIGEEGKALGFAGHVDVVPAGDYSRWTYPPFAAQIHNDTLYGRGAADMKSGIICMLHALKRAVKQGLSFGEGQFYWLITSDEEGEAEYGTQAIVERLQAQHIHLETCIVGEPTASQFTGDTIKVGRRGAISGSININGKAGHVAYPHNIINPIDIMARVVNKLTAISWDQGSNDFPGTGLQITNINSGNFTDNVSPAACKIEFNIRYSNQWNERSLQNLIQELVESVTLDATINWCRPCEPYLSDVNTIPNQALEHLEQAIHRETATFPKLSTSGGTSDGRFIAKMADHVFELGVPNASIHQFDENVKLDDLYSLTNIYQHFLLSYFS
ncbi:MAG: succinyl-diaminopimelate desuccinylase [Kangiellaceae bacterium]|nr:succinyl-diaminopimelate desuccinylase [Kangiellaceae bacterium]